MREITKADIARAREPRVWDLGNQFLYRLCKKHPFHKTDEEIVAKVWLIGRSYSASIERGRKPKQIGDDFYKATVAPGLRKSSLDRWLASLSTVKTPGSAETIVAHKRLMDCFREMTGLEKRSLASKYLHFHRPHIFFLYDSRARKAITRVVPPLSEVPDIQARLFDKEYKDFVRRCIWLRKRVKKTHRTRLTPREIDIILLNIADDESRTRKKESRSK
jgi:hypothetical protein